MQQFQWLKNLTQEINVDLGFVEGKKTETSILEQYSHIVGREYYMEMLADAEARICEYVSSTPGQQGVQPVAQVLMRFFLRVLEQMVLNENEKEPQQIPSLLRNPEFINALLAITIQTH